MGGQTENPALRGGVKSLPKCDVDYMRPGIFMPPVISFKLD